MTGNAIDTTDGPENRGTIPDGVATAETFDAVIEASSDPMVLLDDELRVRRWNRAAEAAFGYSEDAVTTERVPFLGAASETALRTSIADLDRDRPTASVDLVGRTKSGDRLDLSCWWRRIDADDGFSGVLGLVTDVSRPAEGEGTRREKREDVRGEASATLEQVKQIIDGLRPLNRALARGSTPEGITQGVCDRLVADSAYRAAWYATYNPGTERVRPQARAGIDEDRLEVLEVSDGEADSVRGAIGRSIRTRTVHAVDRRTDGSCEADAVPNAVVSGGRFAAVPVVFEATTYGVIGLHTTRTTAFTEYERAFLREIGELVGHAINAAENKRLLASETVTELEFRTRASESVFIEVSEDLGCSFELEAFIPASETAFLAYTSVEGAPPADVVDGLSNSSAVEGSRVIHAEGSRGTIEYRVHESPVSKLLEYGATVKSAVVDDGEERITAVVSPDADTHRLVAGLQEEYSKTTLVSKRSVDRPPRTISPSQDPLETVLTDRQRELLELAYHAGYFESPRHSSGAEVADAVGIASATFYLHVRNAMRNLLEWLDEQGFLD